MKDDPVRIIPHSAIPRCGSFEVRFTDGRPSVYFYWDDEPSRRLRPEHVDKATALERAKAFARTERDAINAKKAPPPGKG